MKKYRKTKKEYSKEDAMNIIQKCNDSIALNNEVITTFINAEPSKTDNFILMAGEYSNKEEYLKDLLNEINYFNNKIEDFEKWKSK